MQPAKEELKKLLEKSQLTSIPILVLGNKNDLPESFTTKELIIALYKDHTLIFSELEEIKDREIACYSISAKTGANVDMAMKWIIHHSRQPIL